jgi:hypothetical protein
MGEALLDRVAADATLIREEHGLGAAEAALLR